LVTLRDTSLPNEQAKLDNYADMLMGSVNAVLNAGTAYPPLNTLTGSTIVAAGTSLAGSTGTLRVAVTSQTGVLQNYTDLDMTTYATVGDLVTALNGIAGISASIVSGNLVIDATSAANGVALNALNSDVGGLNGSQFFGFSNLFSNSATGASTIRINPAMLANSSALAVATLDSGTPAVGDRVVSSGDATAITAIIDMLGTAQSFSAAGNFGSRTSTFASYAAAIISSAAVQASAAQTSADTANAAYGYLSSNLANATGVNIDEETANLTSLQTSYQANAQLIATIRQLYQTLIDTMR